MSQDDRTPMAPGIEGSGARGGTRKAVILAAGRGTRMQRASAGARLDPEQAAMADRGLKALIPFRGAPFIAYVATALADAGIGEICLVVRPWPDPIRAWAESVETRRVRLTCAVQEEPLGSAHALLAAEEFAAGEPILVINGDNYYPPSVLRALAALEGSGLIGFRPEGLVARGNIPPDRIAAYALITVDAAGWLTGIVEKPDPETRRSLEGRALVSMTCWRFTPVIFDACRAISPSVRGEYELPEAVRYAVEELGEPFAVLPTDEGVLDLSVREDVEAVGRWLEGVTVDL